MGKSSGNWGCIVAALLILAALGYVLYGSKNRAGSPSSNGAMEKAAPASNGGEITVQTSETYFALADEARKAWQGDRNHKPVRMLDIRPSRRTMQAILDGSSESPDIWLSSTATLVYRVSDVSGQKFVNIDDSSMVARFPRQPMVFLVRKGRGSELDTYLEKDDPLPGLPPGKFHYASADILKSGGGDSMAQYLKWSFSRQKNGKGDFAAYLTGLKQRGFVPRFQDSGPLAASFLNDTELDFILVHNTLADREIRRHPGKLYKIVPRTTVFEEPVAVVLRSGRERHGESVIAFLAFLQKSMALTSAATNASIGNVGDVNNEKRVWEKVFNFGQRLDNASP